jgi:hypothetical protein
MENRHGSEFYYDLIYIYIYLRKKEDVHYIMLKIIGIIYSIKQMTQYVYKNSLIHNIVYCFLLIIVFILIYILG